MALCGRGMMRLLTEDGCGRLHLTVRMHCCVWTGGVRCCMARVVGWEMRIRRTLQRKGVLIARRR